MIGYDNTGVRHNCFADDNHVIGSVGKGKTNGAVFIDLHSVHELELFAVRIIVIKVCGQSCIFRGGAYSQYRMEIERAVMDKGKPDDGSRCAESGSPHDQRIRDASGIRRNAHVNAVCLICHNITSVNRPAYAVPHVENNINIFPADRRYGLFV